MEAEDAKAQPHVMCRCFLDASIDVSRRDFENVKSLSNNKSQHYVRAWGWSKEFYIDFLSEQWSVQPKQGWYFSSVND